MKSTIVIAILWAFVAQPGFAQTSSDIADQIVEESVGSYLAAIGNCPCPYNTMRNGAQCGGRSAWSKPGGESPICYADDVTEEMIEYWKNRQ